MSTNHNLLVLALGAVAATVASAQQAAPAAGALPTIRPLGKATATSAELMGAVSQVRALSDGRILVNDNLGRKVVLLDASLSRATIVADTTSATANAYSSRAGGLIAYKGDTTLFVDPTSLSMLVIDPKGNITRVISVPRPNDANALIGGPNGTPGFDATGRLVYRGASNIQMKHDATVTEKSGTPSLPIPVFPESAAVVRIDLGSRKLDTVAFVKLAKQNMSVTQTPNGGMSLSSIVNPMPVVDDWAVSSDGRVAVVRGQEYRIDWIDADGHVTGTKIPFAWKRLDDSMKVAFVDSTKKAMEVLRQQALARQQAGGNPGAATFLSGPGGAADAGMAGGAGMMRIEMRMGPGDGPPPQRGASNGAPPAGGPANVTIPPLSFINPSELPDYAPPFTAGSVRGDLDGNVWIRTSNVFNGGSVYDIVNAKGELTDRVLLPAGRVIAGFGKGVVYMGVREGAAGVRLEVAPIRSATP
jgi:hypothetical protein